MTPQKTLAIFGQNVRRRRLAAGLSEDDLAQRCAHCRKLIPELEAGLVNPTLSMILSLSDALGVEPEDLVHGVPAAVAEPRRA